LLDCGEVPQSSASILTWLKRREGSAADLITDFSQSETSEELTVVGFFKVKASGFYIFPPNYGSLPTFDHLCLSVCMYVQELNHEYVQVFYAAAIDLPDIRFVVTQNDEVINKYGFTHDVVLLLREVLHSQFIFF